MAYTTIDDPTIYFNTITYTGDNTDRSFTGVGFQPDWVWVKARNNTTWHMLFDAVRGAGVEKELHSNSTQAEGASDNVAYGYINSFDTDGFSTIDGTSSSDALNESGKTYVAWNWKAGGTAPAITYTVKVVSDSGNKYRFDDFGTSAVTLDLQEGGTYTFDQSDSSNSGHPLRFYTASDKSGGEYTTGVTTTGTAGSSGAKTVITVAASAPTLYYQCSNHAGMGGQANTNSTHGSSNFSGSIQSTVSANTSAGFSIVSWSGSGANATIGHGLGAEPKIIFLKIRTGTNNWQVYSKSIGSGNALFLNTTDASGSNTGWQSTDATSSVFYVSGGTAVNGSGQDLIAYCFAEKKGYSKIGSYTGNSSSDGVFVYLGFKPAMVMVKSNATEHWEILDNKRSNSFNAVDGVLFPNLSNAEETTNDICDFLSNGIKFRHSDGRHNSSAHDTYYMAFAESPFVNSNGVPNNAR
jgi:hypothetical protein